MNLKNSYLELGDQFYQKTSPSPASDPKLILWNDDLAHELNLPKALTGDPKALSQYFSGNQVFPESTPIALAYTGHQFGHFNPRLGDGRAHLLGEVESQGSSWDIQLKGSGPTMFSRGGDGRCALGPAVREFIMSEAMHALGVPTTRALAVVTTGDPVVREGVKPGAVVTRVAASHLRVGTFEYFAAQQDLEAVDSLCHYAVNRHFPELKQLSGTEFYKAFFTTVMRKQIELICQWMRVGFIHGVMNTDNTTISGETIDYGPCAMMNAYDPNTVFSSIDTHGRYRFGHQPQIGQWNMARLAECLLPLIDEDSSKARDIAQKLLSTYAPEFEQQYYTMMGRKVGLDTVQTASAKLINDLLEQMAKNGMDYTQTFHALSGAINSDDIPDNLKPLQSEWLVQWQMLLKEQGNDSSTVFELMRSHNPVVIPRNSNMEAALESCVLDNNVSEANAFLEVLRSPYQEIETTHLYQDSPEDNDRNYQTFCGT